MSRKRRGQKRQEGGRLIKAGRWELARPPRASLASAAPRTSAAPSPLQGLPFNAVYCASKFAIEGLCESLAVVLQSFGVQ